MIQYELFLKEISDFLRSCTIKNKYFAQITADRVMDKYGLDTLPDHFNPYYLRMCGLSTLDLPIPLYLYDEEGNQIINEDRKYRCITDTDASLTQLLLVRMDETDSNGSEIHPVKDKVQLTVNQINRNLAIAYLKYIGFYSPEETEIDDRILIWRLDTVEDKNSALQSYMAGITFTPNDDKRTVVNIITGEYDWENLARQSPVYSDGIFVNSVQEIASIEGMVAGQYAHSLSEKKTYKFNGTVWQRITVDTMLEETIRHYKNENKQITPTTNISFITSYEAPTIEALVVIGDLNWDDMYQNNTGYTTLCEYPTATDIAFEDLTTYLGYSDSETPPVGMRVNFNRNARCWVNDDDTSDIIYTKQEIPQVGDNVYSSHFLNTSDFVINETNNPILVDEIDTVAAGSFMVLTNGKMYHRGATEKTMDVALMHCTLEFNGVEWTEVNTRILFEDELAYQIKNSIGNVKGFTYTTMATPFDRESFDENLILDDENKLCIDRFNCVGWDKPVYVPSHDYKNELTKDFTLYTRFWNHMRDAHVRTALKYHVSSDEYNDVLEKYIDYMDYIKGVCYPVHNLLSTLNWHYEIGTNGTRIRVAYKSDYDAWINEIKRATSSIAMEKNYTLLKYDSTLLKENEAESIISRIKQTLTCVRERWDIREFGYEELYYSAVWSAIWAHLPLTILAQRIKNLRTESVHIDHIWEYLASKGLKDYRTVMDTAQQVFLYKNIDYLLGNEGKRKTLEILGDKLLGTFNAEVRTKSVLLDTTNMANQVTDAPVAGGSQTYHNINGLTESVSGTVKLLSEDLDSITAVTSDLSNRVEDYDDIFYREYLSGLVPEYGDSAEEQLTRIAKTHDEIEIKKHTYAPTKLVEITRGEVTSDLTRISVAFIFQSLMRMLSSQSEIGNGCVVNAIFHGLSNPKTFTVGEVIALIFYALRKQDWYTYYNKYGNQNTNKQDLWKDIVSLEENGSVMEEVAITELERNRRINALLPYEKCAKSNNEDYESDCDHFFYDSDETFNDGIPQRTSVWLPYIGSYYRFNNGNITEVDISLPKTADGLKALIGNPVISIGSKTITRNAAERQLMQIVSPYEYSSLNLKSWNDMCIAEENGTVVSKYDACIGQNRRESLEFNPVVGSSEYGDSSDIFEGSLVGGIVTGSSRSKRDKWYFAGIPVQESSINTHDSLITLLSDQAATMVRHFLMVRNNCNAYFHNAMEYMYKVITVQDELYLDLVPGYRTYSEWFDSDIELKSVFRSIEEGSDQATIYGSIVDNLVSALFPADKITISGSVDQTKYAAMKELFQWMGSYNIAYLNTSSVQYESLYIHPITITPREIIGENTRVMIADKEKHWTFSGMNAWDHLSWTTSEFKSYKFYENWDTALVNWSWLPSPEITIVPTGNVGINVDAETAVRFYGSVVATTRLPEFEVRMSAQPGIYRSGKCSNKWIKNNRSSWTSIRKSTSDDPEIIARFDNEIEDKGHSVIYLEPTGTKGVVVDEETAILLYGSVEAAANIPHFRTKYVTIKSNK